MRLLRFYADWCAPCKRVAPLVAALAARHSLPVDHVDVDESPALAERYNVRSVPTLVLVTNDGEAVYTGSGAECLPSLARAIESL